MVFQGLTQAQATDVWRPFFDWVGAAPRDFEMASAPRIVAVPARALWDAPLLKRFGVVSADARSGAPEGNVFWAGDAEQVGQFLHGYQSTWLPARLLEAPSIDALATALFAGTRHWGFALHFNKGLAGAPPEEVAAARDTAMNPAVLDAFALVSAARPSCRRTRACAGTSPTWPPPASTPRRSTVR